MRFNILSVDELGLIKIELSSMLKNIDVHIVNVADEVEMINVLNEGKISFHSIVWTINSIDLKEFEAIKVLKSKEVYKSIPVIIVSKFTDKKYIIKAIECGAIEYIAKPYDEESVVKKLYRILGVPLGKRPEKKVDDDFVTYNFSEMLNKEIKAASRGAYPLTITTATIMASAQQRAGQDGADALIHLVNKVVRTRLRETDSSFMYGINNIVVLLPFADKSGAECVEKKLRDIFDTHSMIRQRNTGYSLVTASVTLPDDGKIKGKLLEKLEINLAAAVEGFNKERIKFS